MVVYTLFRDRWPIFAFIRFCTSVLFLNASFLAVARELDAVAQTTLSNRDLNSSRSFMRRCIIHNVVNHIYAFIAAFPVFDSTVLALLGASPLLLLAVDHLETVPLTQSTYIFFRVRLSGHQ